MPQIELRPLIARTMVEDGERVTIRRASFAAWRECHGAGQSARCPVEKFAIVLLVVAANGSLTWRMRGSGCLARVSCTSAASPARDQLRVRAGFWGTHGPSNLRLPPLSALASWLRPQHRQTVALRGRRLAPCSHGRRTTSASPRRWSIRPRPSRSDRGEPTLHCTAVASAVRDLCGLSVQRRDRLTAVDRFNDARTQRSARRPQRAASREPSRRNSPGSLAMFAAMRRASSRAMAVGDDQCPKRLYGAFILSYRPIVAVAYLIMAHRRRCA
jgi:hypothetical protein